MELRELLRLGQEKPRAGRVVRLRQIGPRFPEWDQKGNRLLVWAGFKNYWGRGSTPHPDGITTIFPLAFTALSREQGMMEIIHAVPAGMRLREATLSIGNHGRHPLVVVERGKTDEITLAVLATNQVFAARDFRNITILAPGKSGETGLRMDTQAVSGSCLEFVVRANRPDYFDYLERKEAGVDVARLRSTSNCG